MAKRRKRVTIGESEEFDMAVLTEKKRATRPELLGDGKPHPGRRMTEAEFVEWCDEKTRAEWVDGEIVLMEPVSEEHDGLDHSIRSGMDGIAEQNDLGLVYG